VLQRARECARSPILIVSCSILRTVVRLYKFLLAVCACIYIFCPVHLGRAFRCIRLFIHCVGVVVRLFPVQSLRTTATGIRTIACVRHVPL